MKEVRTSAAYSYNAWLPSGRYGLVIISIPYQGRFKKKIYKVELCSQVDPAFNVNFEGEGLQNNTDKITQMQISL